MSRLGELIQELCPDGVEYKPFNLVAQYVRGVTYGKAHEVNDGRDGYNLLRANNITLSSNTLNFDEVKIVDFAVKVKESQKLKKGDILICAGSGSKEHIGKVAYIFEDIDYTFGGFMGVVRANTGAMLSRFMFHILTGSHFKEHLSRASGASSSTINNINNDTWKDFILPVPPIEVQREIVRILDKFTELSAELSAELSERKKQYEYYRHSLLAFGSDIPRIALGDIGKVCMCKRIMKAQTSSTGDVPFYKIGTFGKEPDAFISQELFEEYKQKYNYPKKGDILISAAGTIGRTVVFDGEPSYFQDSNIVWLQHDGRIVTNKYLRYCYAMSPWHISTGGTIARLYNDNITKAVIPVPPLEEQERIVTLLDRFDTLCNDLTAGLPAEIEARQKQYEYYRDKLLTFKPLA